MAKKGQSHVGEVLAERYKVIRELGSGAMGTVYEAQHTTVGRRLAIKVLDPDFSSKASRERFFHEARAAGAISHQHIVPVLDFGFSPSGAPYLVMEYVDGETLEASLSQRREMKVDDAVEICAQILSALEVIHGSGLVHRDIKPANVMLVRVRRPRVFTQLLDFGVARAVHGSWRRPDLTQANEILGTPAYFSPEQATGRGVDPRWDLWAVGVILYEMLAGDLPFRLESMTQVVSDLLNGRLVPMRRRKEGLPEWLYEVVERALHPTVASRYPNATAFLQAMETQRAGAGDDDTDVATVPFVRVELATPPPEIVGRLSDEGAGVKPVDPAPAPAEGDADPAAGNLLSDAIGEIETSLTVPMVKSSSEELAAVVASKGYTTYPADDRRRWRRNVLVAVGVAVLLVLTAGVVVFVALAG
jgi:serine/threonine protein kinase